MHALIKFTEIYFFTFLVSGLISVIKTARYKYILKNMFFINR